LGGVSRPNVVVNRRKITDNQLKLIKIISAKSCCTTKRFDQNGKFGSIPPSKMKVGGVGMTPSPPKVHWVALAAPIFTIINEKTEQNTKIRHFMLCNRKSVPRNRNVALFTDLARNWMIYTAQ